MTTYTPAQDLLDRIENNHRFHPARGDQGERYEAVRGATGSLARSLSAVCPPSRELSVALTKLEEVMFWANAAIARNEAEEEPVKGGQQ